MQLFTLDAGFGRKISHDFERFNVFGAAIGIAGIVDCIDAQPNLLRIRAGRFRTGEREEHCIASRQKRRRDARAHLFLDWRGQEIPW